MFGFELKIDESLGHGLWCLRKIPKIYNNKKQDKHCFNCREYPSHCVSYYKEGYQERMKYLLDTICHYDKTYQHHSSHIFHRELAEEISTYIDKNYETNTTKT